MSENDERLFGMLLYLLSIPFPVLAPLIIWMIKRDDSAFIDYHGKEYFNFLISYAIYSIVSTILMVLLIGFILIFVVGVMLFVFTIIAAVKAYGGEKYRIPLIIRFIK